MYYSFPSRHADGYMRELDHFLDVVQVIVANFYVSKYMELFHVGKMRYVRY